MRIDKCRKNITVVTSPLTERAIVNLTWSTSQQQFISLPVGSYEYSVIEDNLNCTTTVKVYG